MLAGHVAVGAGLGPTGRRGGRSLQHPESKATPLLNRAGSWLAGLLCACVPRPRFPHLQCKGYTVSQILSRLSPKSVQTS